MLERVRTRPLPRHVALIMDGNGRWAKARGLPRTEGHRQGALAAERLIRFVGRERLVPYLTKVTVSTENWARPREEVEFLFRLLEGFVRDKLQELAEAGVRLRLLGDPRRLPARLRAVLRRAGESLRPEQRPPYESGPLYLNFATYEVRVRDKPVALSPIEFRLLRHLVTHPEIVFSRDELLDAVWGRDTFVMPRTVDVHIQKLRSLIEKDTSRPEMILTVRGAGYKFQPDGK